MGLGILSWQVIREDDSRRMDNGMMLHPTHGYMDGRHSYG